MQVLMCVKSDQSQAGRPSILPEVLIRIEASENPLKTFTAIMKGVKY